MSVFSRNAKWAAIIIAACLLIAGCSPAKVKEISNPLVGLKLFNSQGSKSIHAQYTLASENPAAADEIAEITSQPTAIWLNGQEPSKYDRITVDRAMIAAKADGSVPVFVAYNLPQRDIDAGYSSGGAKSGEEYVEWVDSIAQAIGADQAIVIVEPDGLAAIAKAGSRLTQADADKRLRLILHAVMKLAEKPKTYVYIDAGNAGWTNPESMAGLVKAAGVAQADGIAVNVSNFYTDQESSDYAAKISALVGGTGVIVDRSRNGNGAQQPQDNLSWCNPPGRALGRPPEIGGKTDLVQAWLWVKPPGESDANCRPGAPNAGDFWLDYAKELVRNQKQ